MWAWILNFWIFFLSFFKNKHENPGLGGNEKASVLLVSLGTKYLVTSGIRRVNFAC